MIGVSVCPAGSGSASRAHYHNPSPLILDEATTALDNITERIVREAVATIRDEMTIIMTNHCLSTVRNCNVVYVMENGSVASNGTHDELLHNSALFQRMAVAWGSRMAVGS